MMTPGPMLFPSGGMQILACLVHLLGLTFITHCLSRRLTAVKFTSWEGLTQISWPRAVALLIFIDSWCFVFSSAILVFGIGLETSYSVCSAAIYLCIAFYATSKILIYTFLIERVHIVWSPATGRPRFKSPVYIICFVTVALYLVVIVLLLVGRIHFFRDGDSACIIGLKAYSSIPLLSYDLYINVFLTLLFLWPLFRADVMSPTVKKVTLRTLGAATVALTTSTVNMVILTVLKGNELGWVCLGSCAVDVVVNALSIFWVTQGSDSKSHPDASNAPKALQGQERRRMGTDIPKQPLEPEKVKLSDQRPVSFGYIPTTSLPQRHIEHRIRDIESGYHQSPGHKTLKKIGDLFRSNDQGRDGGLQITVTTEYELEESHVNFQSMEDPETERRVRLSE